jgi:2-desacetyl-2-hydroxyethyl bacteriochlorophyllide A dehydrogenase
MEKRSRKYDPQPAERPGYDRERSLSPPEISLIIRTFNEEKFLPGLLEALGRQSSRNFETIVVDSGSLDRTRDIAAGAADKVLRLQSHDFTFGHSLNIGIRETSGKYIALASAHTLPADEHWLDNLINPLRNQETAMVYGRQLGGEYSKFSEIRDMQRTFGPERKILKPPHFFANNANSAIRKDLWQEHPFDESLLGLEDVEWAKYWMERGYQVVYEPEAVLYHIHEENWRQVRRRYYREAVAAHWIGFKASRHALATPFIEARNTISDIGCILSPFEKRLETKRNPLDLVREIVLFRTNKSIGTIKGLLDGAVMKNPSARKDIFFDRACKAVVIHGPGKASLEEIRIPEIKPGEVLIRVAYEAVCGTDLEILDGSLGYYKRGMAKYPIVPGHEFSGFVVSCGPNINHLETGDPVVVECIQSCGNCDACRRENWIACRSRTELGVIGRNGGYSEYVVVPGHFAHRLPTGFDMQKACLCEPLAVALKGLKRLRRTWRDRKTPKQCAVVGAGSLGHLCARILQLWGHQVTVFDCNRGRLGYFNDSGIEVSDNLTHLYDFENLVEVTGSPEALDAILHESPAGSRILLLGLPYAQRQYTFEDIVAYDKMIVGSVGSAAKHFEMAIELLPRIDTRFLIEKILPFSQYAQAWELARSQKHLKVILEIS